MTVPGSVPEHDPLVVREDRGVASVITLNRPSQRNALRYESWTALGAELAAATESGARAIVLTGAKGFFCAGGDLKTGPAHGNGALSPAGRVEHAGRVMGAMQHAAVPIIAAIEGAAVGLGWSLALACDLVVASADAFFAAPFVARAVVPDGGLAWRLTRQLGRHRAGQILLRGVRLSADEAHSAGLVTDVVEPGTALDHALDIAGELARADAGAIELTKRLITAVDAADLAAFAPFELSLATVAQQRGAAAAARTEFS